MFASIRTRAMARLTMTKTMRPGYVLVTRVKLFVQASEPE